VCHSELICPSADTSATERLTRWVGPSVCFPWRGSCHEINIAIDFRKTNTQIAPCPLYALVSLGPEPLRVLAFSYLSCITMHSRRTVSELGTGGECCRRNPRSPAFAADSALREAALCSSCAVVAIGRNSVPRRAINRLLFRRRGRNFISVPGREFQRSALANLFTSCAIQAEPSLLAPTVGLLWKVN
jgi:hypothetical protein